METYKSGLKWYVVILLVNVVLCLTTRLSLFWLLINHLAIIVFMFIENIRFKRFLKRIQLNVYAYRVGGLNFYSRIKRILKTDQLNETERKTLYKYIEINRVLFILGITNAFVVPIFIIQLDLIKR